MSQQERWQVSGDAAEAYERFLVPTMFRPWAHDLIAHAELQPDERVLDVACGTGIVARVAAEKLGASGHVVGVDLNAGMLAVARTQTPSGLTNVEWREGDVNALPCDDTAFDVVCCQQGLQFFPDQANALREMRRVLTPGGRLVLSVLRPLPYNPDGRALSDALERYVSPEAAAGMRAPFGFGEAEALHALLAEAGFQDIRIQTVTAILRHPSPSEFFPGWLTALPFSSAIVALDSSTQDALLNDILTDLQPYIDGEGLAVPKEYHLAVARK